MKPITPPLDSETQNRHNTTQHSQSLWQKYHHYRYVKPLIIIMVLIMVYGGYNWTANLHVKDQKLKDASQARPIVVQIATVKNQDVPVYIKALGNVSASVSINVKTQIDGQLTKILFKEGQNVRQGDLLAKIDDQPIKAQIRQYEGQLMRDKALLDNAERDLGRYQTLDKNNFVAEQTVDTQRELVQQYKGTVESDEGLLEAARVNLAYCKITAPVSGRLGLQLVDPGNYVQISDTNGIVTLNVFQPISVAFSVAEDQLPEILKQFNQQTNICVEAFDRSQNQHLQTGKLAAIDNQIDPTTGMVKLKASFNNDPETLFPNQFVNIKLLLRTLKDALVIPSAAIQYGVQGPFVYIVGADENVQAKTVIPYLNLDTEETVITSGLTTGQKIVIEGTDKLKDGMKVSIHNADQSYPNSKPSTLKNTS